MKLTEKDITAEVAKSMRQGLGLTQRSFWEPLGVKQSVGHRYETDTRIPRSVRILLVARYVAGLTLDANTPDDVDQIAKLAEFQASGNVAAKESAAARKVLQKATEHIQNAQASLTRV